MSKGLIEEVEYLVHNKQYDQAEELLFDKRCALPIEEQYYYEHRIIARELFNLYNKVFQFKAADNIIDKTMECLPKSHHPLFTINETQKEISFTENILSISHNKKYIIQALNYFPTNNIYIKIDPFEFGTELVCYKDKQGNVDSIILDHNADDDEELRNRYKIKDIRSKYQKINTYFGY